MKFTIVTVCYNAVDLIEPTLKSVIDQTYPDVEYIVVDGASTDGTGELLRKYADRIDRVISEPDKGIYDAMNKGIAAATGDYINFMNAGDTFSSPTVLEEVSRQIKPGSDVIYGNSTVVMPDGRRFIAPRDPIELLRRRPVYRHNAAFTRTALHKEIPFATERSKEFEYALDYNNIFNIWYKGGKFQKIETDIVSWLKTGTSNHPLHNIMLNFRIAHQFEPPTLRERMDYAADILRAFRRELIIRLNPSYNFNDKGEMAEKGSSSDHTKLQTPKS